MSIFIFVIIGIFTFIYTMILRDFTTNDDGFSYIPIVMFGIFGLIFAGIIGYMVWVFVYDLKNGIKNCFEGIIEDKRLHIKHSTSTSTGSRGSGRKTTTKRYYHMIVDGTQHTIEYDMYANVSVGDHVYFEVAPKSNVILHYETSRQAASEIPRNIPRYSRESYPDSKIREAAFTREDKNNLKEFYKSKVTSRVRTIAFLSVPIIILAIYGLASLLVFIFPLPLILLYQLYKLLKMHLNYKKTIDTGRKKLTSTYVTDKSFTTVSNNGRTSEKCTLITTYKSIITPEMVYQNIEVGDEIIIHEAFQMSHIMGISVDEAYYSI
ncbi:hypothetical protein IMCC3317_33070 [Kordia antarctica]|uniref:DUF3592 domain-containing protein n=1 Tax=Kordia antarctica TaxID=1218801 RepID=A0A7L4ZPX8_9FLAO|nr:hypothetical protein [Kordia antarctica]QHI37924.1 hypothetical protein IMCC3317_33070 [Kordia antarctica]